MTFTKRTPSLIAALIIAIIILLVSLDTEADEFNVYDERNHHFDEVIDGKDGRNGIDGINGTDGRNGINATNYSVNTNRLSRGIAISGAMSQIPALSHVNTHGHSGIGTGVASYGNQNAFAIGLLHQENNRSYKATIGLSGSESIVGAGASWAFE